jgi:hypothetical protein
MDAALELVGLPVKCAWGDCGTKGFVKPRTDYGGWVKRWHKQWYCPKHAEQAQKHYDAIVERYKNPPVEVAGEDTTQDELYKLLD